MAQPMTLSSWSAEDVRLADVLDAVDALRRPEAMPATRTSVLTLAVVAARQASADAAMAALAELGGRHPARVLTLLPDAAASAAGIDAEVRLLGGEAEGHAVWFEDVVLVVRGEAARHLDSLIEPFTLSDLPVVAWFVDALPAGDDPMVSVADVALVDSRTFGDTDAFTALHALSERVPVVDLSWQRVRPWRELVAGLFESPDTRPFLRRITSARVVGHTGPRHLLAGWLADRLELPMSEVHCEAAEHVSITLAAERATFEVVRLGDERVVRARASLEAGPTAETIVPLPPSTPGWGLADALSHLERDTVYERALRCAIALAARQ